MLHNESSQTQWSIWHPAEVAQLANKSTNRNTVNNCLVTHYIEKYLQTWYHQATQGERVNASISRYLREKGKLGQVYPVSNRSAL